MCESGQFSYFWRKNLSPLSPLLEERGQSAEKKAK